MKSAFVQPRFEGARFSDHTLPLDVAKDLAAYEALLVDLAKHLYLIDHEDRQRVPKNFSKDFHLHIERLDSGSTKPVLSVVAAGVLALGSGNNVYFEKARDLINECIAAPQGQLPPNFPQELLSYFNQIGRSLRDGEWMELPLPNNGIATLTPERRKNLVLAAGQFYEREVELSGTIEEVDWVKNTFRLRTLEGDPITVPMPLTVDSLMRNNGGKDRHLLTFSAVVSVDSWDKIQKVLSADTFELQLNYELSTRFDEIRTLSNGWFEGAGVAPDSVLLEAFATKLISGYPEKATLPTIVPTPEGNLLMEWNLPGEPSVDISLSEQIAYFHRFLPDFSDEEYSFPLTSEAEWKAFFSHIALHIPQLT